MTEIAKADIFFVVTTIAVVAIAVGVVVALVYVIRILRDANAVSKRARKEGEAIIDDVSVVRGSIVKLFTGSRSKKK